MMGMWTIPSISMELMGAHGMLVKFQQDSNARTQIYTHVMLAMRFVEMGVIMEMPGGTTLMQTNVTMEIRDLVMAAPMTVEKRGAGYVEVVALVRRMSVSRSVVTGVTSITSTVMMATTSVETVAPPFA